MVTPQLTRNDHIPLQKWKTAEITPIPYKIAVISFERILAVSAANSFADFV